MENLKQPIDTMKILVSEIHRIQILLRPAMNLRWINGYFIPRVGHMILDLGYLAGRNHGVCHGKQVRLEPESLGFTFLSSWSSSVILAKLLPLSELICNMRVLDPKKFPFKLLIL